MALLFLLAAIVGCVFARPSSENVTPVKVTLYYESLCSGCRSFVPRQLLAAYTDATYDYPSLISELTLVPFGGVRIINASQHDYKCQHGQAECDGNRLHGCAIEHISDKVTVLKYISCLDQQKFLTFNSRSRVYPIDKCQEELPEGLYQKILSCYNSNESWEIFQKNGQKTRSTFPRGGFVPYVTFNDKVDQQLALGALKDFRATLRKVAGVDA